MLFVASFTDAWIETKDDCIKAYNYLVASFTDAWIETKGQEALDFIKKSHLLQMRGLKHLCLDREHHRHKVASFTDAWIETLNIEGTTARQTSHLLQMRGLKRPF